MKISLIATIFNEENSIKNFLDSILLQSKNPDEIVLVDGGSTDRTIEGIKKYESRIKKKKITFKLIVKIGNRSKGRNEAIRNAASDIIVCSDAGNILDKNWLKNISKPFEDKSVDVVAGYYKGLAKNVFQKCLIPYVLVMPDQVNPKNFLPATRSIAFKKSIWKKAGGFPEEYNHNEDYVFAKRLEKIKTKIIFAKEAIVYWLPRNNFKDAYIMFFRFAFGDAEAGLWRSKVFLIYLRYIFAIGIFLTTLLYNSTLGILLLLVMFIVYWLWAVMKNYRYVNDRQVFFFLPLIQFTADGAVLTGTFFGLLKRFQISEVGK